jgi:hypothetical protein
LPHKGNTRKVATEISHRRIGDARLAQETRLERSWAFAVRATAEVKKVARKPAATSSGFGCSGGIDLLKVTMFRGLVGVDLA